MCFNRHSRDSQPGGDDIKCQKLYYGAEVTLVPVNNDEAPESGVASAGLGLARADAALLPQTRAPQLQPSE